MNLVKEENSFELIYCEYHSVHHDGPLNVRSSYSDNIYPNPSIAPPLRHIKLGFRPEKDHIERERELRGIRELAISNLSTKPSISEREAPEEHAKEQNKERVKHNTVATIKVKRPGVKLQTASMTDQLEAHEPPPPLSQRDNKTMSVIPLNPSNPSQLANGHERVYNHNGVEETTKKIENILDTYILIDNEHIIPLISKLLSVLTNWELHSNKEISTACGAILTLSESKMCGALTEPVNVPQMINLLESQNVPLKIQVTLV